MTNLTTVIQFIAVAAIPVIFAITLHEAAHGWVASKLGDKTALMLGRVTMNPLKHIDPIGTIAVPIVTFWLGGFLFGWAKPVPVSYHNLNNPRRDMAIVAAAGPLSNLLMALCWGLIAKLNLVLLGGHTGGLAINSITGFIHFAAQYGIIINCVLMIINLIPIPPLDGSRVLASFLPPGAAAKFERIEPYGIFIVLGVLMLGRNIIFPIIIGFYRLIASLFGVSG
ncbi:MAG: site-2 protease family protein [Gammaproteobacteria bacterium]|nr:site-2 protease family protein [Gammaproteobacteria bacterium]